MMSALAILQLHGDVDLSAVLPRLREALLSGLAFRSCSGSLGVGDTEHQHCQEEFGNACCSLLTAALLADAASEMPLQGGLGINLANLLAEANENTWLTILQCGSVQLRAAASLTLAAWFVKDPAGAVECFAEHALPELMHAAVGNLSAQDAICCASCIPPCHVCKARQLLQDASCLLLIAALSVPQYSLRLRIFLFNTNTWQRIAVERLLLPNAHGRSPGADVATVPPTICRAPVAAYLLLIITGRPVWFDPVPLVPLVIQALSVDRASVDAGPWRLAVLRLAETLLLSSAGASPTDDVVTAAEPPHSKGCMRQVLAEFVGDAAQWQDVRNCAVAEVVPRVLAPDIAWSRGAACHAVMEAAIAKLSAILVVGAAQADGCLRAAKRARSA
eukprot:gnl/TRDRNA2_/TRDRNA2_169174_c0_seq1.p1 gnl/TRDRNA2_/TRDRNA2_169174_c0~~gnl/TRDRNA2_/TRDRNA2_169174_c0_seq1.p1  ORF type:complete len:390 (+),score=73.31 gnl/TRDRNA2_/TRDRNA2_169174_c0_seq1:3-1172(+)